MPKELVKNTQNNVHRSGSRDKSFLSVSLKTAEFKLCLDKLIVFLYTAITQSSLCVIIFSPSDPVKYSRSLSISLLKTHLSMVWFSTIFVVNHLRQAEFITSRKMIKQKMKNGSFQYRKTEDYTSLSVKDGSVCVETAR